MFAFPHYLKLKNSGLNGSFYREFYQPSTTLQYYLQ